MTAEKLELIIRAYGERFLGHPEYAARMSASIKQNIHPALKQCGP